MKRRHFPLVAIVLALFCMPVAQAQTKLKWAHV